MNIVLTGRGSVGGGLTALWRKAGHEVTAVGRPGALLAPSKLRAARTSTGSA